MSVPGGIDLAFNSAPELVNSPGTAVDVGSSIDPTTFAPVVSHAQNVQNTLQAVGQSEADATAQEKADAVTKSVGGSGGIFGSIGHAFQSIPGIHGVEHALGTAVHYLGSPLREIQRDYRFVHTVWTKNGPIAGLLATLGVTAGAALGGLAGPQGALIGGEAAAFLERQGAELLGGHGKGYTANGQTNYNEGLAATADASSDPHMKISFGRDLSSALGNVPGLHTLANTDKGVGKFVSGSADAGADWFADPIVVGAKFKTRLKLGDYGTAAKAVARARTLASTSEAASGGVATKILNAGQRLLSGDLLRTMQRDGAAQFFDRVAPGIQLRTSAGDTVAANSEQLNALYNAPIAGASYRRALGQIAKLNTGDIVAKFPELQDLAPDLLKAPGQDAIKGLGSATTAEEAHQVFVNAIENAHFADRLDSLSVVPTRTLTRTLGSKLSDFAQNIDQNAATVTSPEGAVTRALPRQSLTGAAVTAGGKALTGDLSGAKDAITGAIARKINTFSAQQPFALDTATRDLSAQHFSVDALTQRLAPGAAKGLLNMMKFSMGTQRARYWVGQFANADSLAEQKRIFAEAHFELLKAAGLPDDAQMVQEARKIAADSSAGPLDSPGGIAGGNGTYGFGKEFGSSVDEQPAADGIITAALHNYQTSHTFSYANFADVKQLQRELSGSIKANYGRFDDLVARKYIGGFFKPLALVNAGFGLRVALAEAIPESIREGAMTNLRSIVGTKAAKMQYKLVNGEDDHILAAAASALSLKGSATSLVTGIDRLLNDPIARERAMGLVMKHGGQVAAGVARTGEHTGGGFMDQGPGDKARQGVYHVKGYMKNQPQLKYKGDGTFNYYSNDSANWDGHWHAGLTAMAQDPAVALKAKDLLEVDRTPRVVPASGDFQLHRVNAGEIPPASSKPQGLYYNIVNDPATFDAHHVPEVAEDAQRQGLPVVRRTAYAAPSRNTLVVPSLTVEHARFPRMIGGKGPASAGISALKELTSPEEFERLRQMSKPALVAELNEKFPGADYSKYFDSYELLEAYAGQLARAHGYDSILQREPGDPNGSDEFVALHDDATRFGSTKETPEEANKRATSEVVAREARRIKDVINESPDALPFYISEAARLRGYANIQAGNWTAEDFAARRVDSVRGITEGADDTVHTNLLQDLAARRAPDLKDVSSVDLPSRPAQIFGENSVPYIGPNLPQRIVSYGFAHVVDPIINGLSRDPQYFTAYSKQLDTLLPAVQSGHLDQETAERIAETRAVVGMLPKIHNTALKSQFAMLARNYMPFYFAQEQALRRAGRLIATNPEAIRQYQLVNQGLNDPGFVHTDDQGNRFFMYPHVGVLQTATNGLLGLFGDSVQTGLPLTVQGSMTSLQTLLPDFNMPGVSPLVSLPLNKLAGLFPELSPTVKSVTGAAGFGQSSFDALVPNTVAKAAWRVMNPNEKDATYANAVFSAMAASFYHGTAPDPNASDSDKAAWINRIKNNARSTFIAKAIVGLVSPLAPQVSNADPGLRDEFYKEVKKVGYATALSSFLREHGTKAISYTVAQTQPSVNGAYLPYTNLALNYLNSPLGQQLIHSPYSVAGAFLTPQAQGPGDVQTIHAELIRNHLRSKDTPQQFLDAIDVALGNNAITPGLDAHKKAQAELANDPKALALENSNWSDYLQTQQLANPTWYNYWTSPQRKNLAQQAYQQMFLLYEGKAKDSAGNAIAAPTTPQANLVRNLLESYTTHAQEMAQLSTAPARKVERENWTAYLDQEAKNPLLYSVINAVFSRLDAAGVTPNGGGLGQGA